MRLLLEKEYNRLHGLGLICKGGFIAHIRFSSAFERFFFSTKQDVLFRPRFYISTSALTRLCHILDKSFPKKKKNFVKGTALFRNIALNVHTQNY